jgi:hypothetical protein
MGAQLCRESPRRPMTSPATAPTATECAAQAIVLEGLNERSGRRQPIFIQAGHRKGC